jgi:hypothetical protein
MIEKRERKAPKRIYFIVAFIHITDLSVYKYVGWKMHSCYNCQTEYILRMKFYSYRHEIFMHACYNATYVHFRAFVWLNLHLFQF